MGSAIVISVIKRGPSIKRADQRSIFNHAIAFLIYIYIYIEGLNPSSKDQRYAIAISHYRIIAL